MRFLKKYILFEVASKETFTEQIILDIKDICVEFDDYDIKHNFEVDLNYDGISGWNKNTRAIKIYLRDISNRFFTWEDIKEVVLRLSDYIKYNSCLEMAIETPTSPPDKFVTKLDDFIRDIDKDDEYYRLCVVIYDKEALKD